MLIKGKEIIRDGEGKMSKTINLEELYVQNNEIDAIEIDGEVAMMNIEKGKYHGFNDVGSHIWELIKLPITGNQIIENLLNEYDVDAETCKASVINFLSDLYTEDLIKKI